MISFGSNPITRTVIANTRIMLTRKTVFRVTHINDFEYNGAYTGADGLIKCLVLQTTLRDDDDTENNIAWNENQDKEVILDVPKIVGDSSIMIGSKKTYSSIVNSGITWKIKENTDIVRCNVVNNEAIVSVTQDINHVGEKFTLLLCYSSDSTILDNKEITLKGFI